MSTHDIESFVVATLLVCFINIFHTDDSSFSKCWRKLTLIFTLVSLVCSIYKIFCKRSLVDDKKSL
jgi:hypothetical protein